MTDMTAIIEPLHSRFATCEPDHEPATALTLLSHEAILAISGPDAERFLQGQITCDISRLPVPGSTPGARCNPKGRMQSSFRLLRSEPEHYLLALEQSLLTPQLADLNKYAVFFRKARLEDASQHWCRLGLWGEQADRALEQAGLAVPETTDIPSQTTQGLVIRLSDGAYELWLPADKAPTVLEQLCQQATATHLNQWLLRQIRAGIGQVMGPTQESFIPQMLNLQLQGGVSFKKGCYTGQEIVARMQYLGKLKRRMFRLLLAGTAIPPPGTLIVERDSGKPIGELVIAARTAQRVEMLAVLQKDAAQYATLSLADADGPLLTLADLPYDHELAATEADNASE